MICVIAREETGSDRLEMRMLRWTCGVMRKDNKLIRNEHVRRSVKVAPVTMKIAERKLKWYMHVLRIMVERKTENRVEMLCKIDNFYGKCGRRIMVQDSIISSRHACCSRSIPHSEFLSPGVIAPKCLKELLIF